MSHVRRSWFHLLVLPAAVAGLALFFCSRPASPSIMFHRLPIIQDGNLDHHPAAKSYRAVAQSLPPLPGRLPFHIGVVLKNFGNQYWQLLAQGIHEEARLYDTRLSILAGSAENDPDGQAEALSELLKLDLDALIVAPQTDDNLTVGIQKARDHSLLVVHINEADSAGVEYLVGVRQYESGRLAASLMRQQHPDGGQFALINGPPNSYAAMQRARGFRDHLSIKHRLETEVAAGWDHHQAMQQTTRLLREFPDLIGVYCTNDNMALGACEAVRRLPQKRPLTIVGTDGIAVAMTAIRDGELTGTVDTHAYGTGAIALETTLRLLTGQTLPPIVYCPQKIVTLQGRMDDQP
jgi:ribose transport system substrate-binding protein